MIKAVLTIDDIASDNTSALVDCLVEREIPVFLEDGTYHIILMYDHEETFAMVPGYYKIMLEHVMENGVTFVKPEFL